MSTDHENQVTTHGRTEERRVRAIALLGTYPPRKCGIASFTGDLASAFSEEHPASRVSVVAINDHPDRYAYPREVLFEITADDLADYRLAAGRLAMDRAEVLSVQHEFGIFGGAEGSHLLKLLSELHIPVVTTLHTVLRSPTSAQTRILHELERISDRLVVICDTGRQILEEVYRVPASKIAVIRHGVPDVPFLDSAFYKERLGAQGKMVILSFGLLSPDKGIETMLQALPDVVARHPEVRYVVLGATHPNIVRNDGEVYRAKLEQLTRELGIEEHVVFENRFVEMSELCEFLGGADIYVTPYVKEAQISSGTLAYAMAHGKAVVSTPYWYASEALADGRGCIVPFRDASALAAQINQLLDDPVARDTLRRRAYLASREHTWPNVARRYLDLFEEIIRHRQRSPRRVFRVASRVMEPAHRGSVLPEVSLDHLRRMTDDVGMLQHSTYSVPKRWHGYCTDDVARALIVANLALASGDDAEDLRELSLRYLAFLRHAFEPLSGRFRNFMTYDRRWIDEEGSADAHGRAVWALGVCAARTHDASQRTVATRLIHAALPRTEDLPGLRPMAFALLGLDEFLRHTPGDARVKWVQNAVASRMLGEFERQATPDWRWPEDLLSYSNATVPHALIRVGEGTDREDMVRMGLWVLDWIAGVQTENGRFVPVGSDGWFPRGGTKARFGQQPIEADATAMACLDAFRVTNDQRWLEEAWRAYRWFLGENDLGVRLYDAESGGCRDGLAATGVNENEGAESTLCWLHTAIQMRRAHATGVLDASRQASG